MKALYILAAAGLSLLGSLAPVSAQRYGDPYSDYRGRDRSYGYGDRYDDYEERPRYRERRVVFDEYEYLRCNRDVRRAVSRGEFESGLQHFQRHGRRENRRLSC